MDAFSPRYTFVPLKRNRTALKGGGETDSERCCRDQKSHEPCQCSLNWLAQETEVKPQNGEFGQTYGGGVEELAGINAFEPEFTFVGGVDCEGFGMRSYSGDKYEDWR